MSEFLLSSLRYFKACAHIAVPFVRDWMRYVKWSASGRVRTKGQLQGYMIRYTHAVRAGMSYQPYQAGFGQSYMSEFVRIVDKYISQFGVDIYVVVAVKVLKKYVELNIVADVRDSQMEDRITKVVARIPEETLNAGACRYHKDECAGKTLQNPDFGVLMTQRSSCRQYLHETIPLEKIRFALSQASLAPSACNRQPWRTYIVDYPKKKEALLDLQNNNTAWRYDADKLMVISVDEQLYCAGTERNAPFVDGGIFAMAVVLSLQANGIDSCILNTNLNRRNELGFRRLLGVPENEVLILMIAVGVGDPARLPVASMRRPLEEIIVMQS